MPIPSFQPNNQIAAGYNNTAGLVSWDTLVVAGEPQFIPPTIFSKYRGGKRLYRADGSVYFSGYPTVVNAELTMTVGQLEYLMVTFCGGGFSGFVTAKCRLTKASTYNVINTVFEITDHADNKKIGTGWDHYKFSYKRIVVLS